MKYVSILSLLFLFACSGRNDQLLGSAKKMNAEIPQYEKAFDSTSLYNFFKGKETLNFAENNRNDSIVFTVNEYGLPVTAIVYYRSSNDFHPGEIFGKRTYYYNVIDSTETIQYYTFHDALNLTEVRQFDSLGRVVYYKSIIMNDDVNEVWYYYDKKGRRIELDPDLVH